MAEKILIQLDLDDQLVKRKVGETADETDKRFRDLSINIEQNITNSVGKIKSTTDNLVGSLGLISTALLSTPPAGKGLFGTISKLGFVSTSLFVTSEALSEIDSKLASVISGVTRLAAILTGGLAAGFSFLILKGSELAQNIGTKLVSSLQELSDKSLEYLSSVNILNKVIENFNIVTGGAVGLSKDWTNILAALSTELNISVKSLNKSAQEIVSVGSQIGLTAEQMQKLTVISAEYAKINNKDVFDVTIALVNALMGNAQAAQTLGLKLGQASIQAFAFEKGITKSIESLSENERVQLRFNKLLKQYDNVAGIAAEAASQLADQENALNVTLEKLNASFGQGVAFVENYNIASKALNFILNTLNEGFIKTLGALSALGARFLQIGGFITEMGFKLFIAVKAYNLLKNILDLSFDSASLFNTKLKILNLSIADIAEKVSGGKIGLESLVATFVAARLSVNGLINSFLVFKQSGALSITASLGQAFNALLGILSRFMVLIAPLTLAIAKFGAIAALVISPFILLKEILEEVEQRTGAFTTIFNILKTTLMEGVSIFQPLIGFFSNLSNTIKELASKAFGFLVYGVSNFINVMAELVKNNPFGIFSDESITKINNLQMKLATFTDSLKSVAFDISKIPGEAERAIAGTIEKTVINLEDLANKLNTIRQNYKDFGLTDIEKIRANQTEAMEILRLGFENKLLQEDEYNKLRAMINQDSADKIKAIQLKANEESLNRLKQANQIINQGIANGLSQGIQKIAENLAKGKSIFADFGTWIIQLFGDLAIQLGQFYIADGIAKLALLGANPAAQITAGASLIALGSILKAFFAGGLGGGKPGSTAAVGSQPAPGQFSTPQSDLANPDSVDEERQAPKTNVQVVVQGSLVQQEELGEFITKTLNESFGKQGVTLVDARFA